MSEEQQHGVVFPRSADGHRSTAAVGRAVVADALRRVDPAGARAAEQETNWRTGYLEHFRRLVEAGLISRDAALSIAGEGLRSLRGRMRVLAADGAETSVAQWAEAEADPAFGTATVCGSADPERELTLPYRGSRLAGDDLSRRLDAWVTAGVVEPSAAEAVHAVRAHPDWLRLEGRTVAVLGAGAEMGPLQALLRWGVRVAAVDLPRPALWERLLDTARHGAGTLLLPVPAGTTDVDPGRAGADLIASAPAVADWLVDQDGGLVAGNYVYADSATNVRMSTAVDVLTTRVAEARPDTALAFLATPTDVFAVPEEAVTHSVDAYEARSTTAKVLSRPLRCARSAAAGCCGAATCRAPTPASTTAWSRSRAPTTPSPSGCSAGGRRWPATPAPRSR